MSPRSENEVMQYIESFQICAKCHCYIHSDIYVNCSERGLTSLPTGLPRETTHLDVSGSYSLRQLTVFQPLIFCREPKRMFARRKSSSEFLAGNQLTSLRIPEGSHRREYVAIKHLNVSRNPIARIDDYTPHICNLMMLDVSWAR